MTHSRFSTNQIIILIVVIAISVLFFVMIRPFLMVILLAGIFSAMAQPVYHWFLKLFKNRKNLSSAFTLTFIFLVIFLPLTGFLGIVTDQAIKISHSVKPEISRLINEPSVLDEWITPLPFSNTILEYKDEILNKAGQLVGRLSTLLLNSASNLTVSTANFFLLFFIFLYTMFFFIKEGGLLLNKILYYLPLADKDERRMLEKFTSVTRATIKGTMLIGVIQGGSAGLAFWAFGINGALFWGTVMTVLSIVPVIGSSLVWFPAVILKAASGHVIQAIFLWAICGLIVGSVDNILRPKFVGKDTKMHELLIFFAILGGISLFGMVGFLIGPIVAALFITVWDIYGETFKDYLPKVVGHSPEPPKQMKTKKSSNKKPNKKTDHQSRRSHK